MLSIKHWILAPAIALAGFGITDAPQAKADFGFYTGRGISISIGSGYSRYRGLNSYGPSYRSLYGHRVVSPYQTHYTPGHYHYHPRQIIPHGNHYDVVPGHYDYYQGGHHGHGRSGYGHGGHH